MPSPPLLLSSTINIDDILEADIPLRKKARFTAPTGRFEVGRVHQLLLLGRQVGHTLAHTVDYGFIDTMDASICAAESRAMTAAGVDARALLGAQVSILRRERRYFSLMASSYEHEAVIALHAWSHSKSKIQAMECQIRALQRDKMPPKKRTATTTITTTPMIDAQLMALIAQGVADALEEFEANRTNRNGDDSHNSGTGSRRTERAARECTYSDFLKYQPLNFKGYSISKDLEEEPIQNEPLEEPKEEG
nr:hypothetical protein [Tanacetum cinerariifolium]